MILKFSCRVRLLHRKRTASKDVQALDLLITRDFHRWLPISRGELYHIGMGGVGRLNDRHQLAPSSTS